jgi:polyisoprenoid-binding protein YceI
MKKIVLIAVAVMLGGFFWIGLDTSQAKVESISERFKTATVLDTPVSGSYTFDAAHSAIGFKVVHMGLINVPGYFKDFTGVVDYDADSIEKSSVSFSAKTASVDTRVERRDNHLRSADFFDAEKHPELTFKSTKVVAGKDELMVTGDFTLRGVTKSITIPVKIAGFKDSRGRIVMGAMAETTIKRSEFGVNYGLNGAVSDEVKIELNIEAAAPKEPEAKKSDS